MKIVCIYLGLPSFSACYTSTAYLFEFQNIKINNFEKRENILYNYNHISAFPQQQGIKGEGGTLHKNEWMVNKYNVGQAS